ncbi:hypothetical protein EVAR_26903_1 [Eumeta japonica]|uniref:Uncharacterized protein n=1 Tax=Eumeta variegata TaxID=151549 RepID=A0A4C1VSW7_EUMVA|nr:hypothetical protein EVAR_26903_1 [Eumeta japonica]
MASRPSVALPNCSGQLVAVGSIWLLSLVIEGSYHRVRRVCKYDSMAVNIYGSLLKYTYFLHGFYIKSKDSDLKRFHRKAGLLRVEGCKRSVTYTMRTSGISDLTCFLKMGKQMV